MLLCSYEDFGATPLGCVLLFYSRYGWLNGIEGFSALVAHLLKVAWGEAGGFFELAGEVCHAAVAQLIGNFAQRQLVVHNQLLYLLHLLGNNILLNGFSLHFRE